MKEYILFTGASGFLGTSIKPILNGQYKISTLGITKEDDYKCNLSDQMPKFNKQYSIILHAAGKAHVVPKTEKEKQLFFDINYQGTINLCKGLEEVGVPESFIFISTVAVYGCEFGENISEDHPLNGNTPYALSKIKAEQFLVDWCQTNNVILTILRPSLLAGPNPPGNLGAMIDGIRTNKYFSIGGGKACKSVLMVQDIANLIPIVAKKGGIYNVCDNIQPTFRELEILISSQLGKNSPINVPYWIANIFALIGDCLGKKAPINTHKLGKICKSLTFSNKKAVNVLGWKPLNVLENFKI